MNSNGSASSDDGSKDYWRQVAVASGMRFIDPLPEPQKDALELFSKEDAISLRSLPLESGEESCVIAISDPMDFDVMDSLTLLIRKEVEFVAAYPSDIDAAIAHYYT